jgi:hypothetical protein
VLDTGNAILAIEHELRDDMTRSARALSDFEANMSSVFASTRSEYEHMSGVLTQLRHFTETLVTLSGATAEESLASSTGVWYCCVAVLVWMATTSRRTEQGLVWAAAGLWCLRARVACSGITMSDIVCVSIASTTQCYHCHGSHRGRRQRCRSVCTATVATVSTHARQSLHHALPPPHVTQCWGQPPRQTRRLMSANSYHSAVPQPPGYQSCLRHERGSSSA